MVKRFECLQFLAQVVGEDALVTLWGGGAIQEWKHLRPHPPSISLSMGGATPTGLGLALALPHRRVVVIDGDGGLLLNLGVLATLGNLRPPNLKVVIMDNECYESIGAMPTATAGRTDLAAMARGAGIEKAETTRTLEEFKDAVKRAIADNDHYFIVAKVEVGIKKLPPPAFFSDGIDEKYRLVRYIEETEKINIITPTRQRSPEHLFYQ
ncbi:MAG: thiamine pyrophosphate-binding protein [Chloroflexi bacterium]|nr:thiamine pyrophosphate-binding protein [Chloroflexota bacterium]